MNVARRVELQYQRFSRFNRGLHALMIVSLWAASMPSMSNRGSASA